MRNLTLAAIIAATAAAPGLAQTGAGTTGSPRAAPVTAQRPPVAVTQVGAGPSGQARWGRSVNGRWHGGVQAPGGWRAYRRPVRGWVMPRYWYAPAFVVRNYAAYGLTAPPPGYYWSRYYDDAVLIDDRGAVYDTRGGIDWDRYDDGYRRDGYDVSRQNGYVDGRYMRRDGDVAARPDDGVGGAVIGGIVGGVAGNAIARRGNRLAGTLIGAGAGVMAGAAIDKAEDSGRRVERRIERREYESSYGVGYRMPGDDRSGPYREPMYDDRFADGAPPVIYGPRGEIVQGYAAGELVKRRVIRRGGAGDDARPYTTVVRGPGTVTTVTVVPAVTTTTTTTEYFYDTASPVRHVVGKWRPRAKASRAVCRCK